MSTNHENSGGGNIGLLESTREFLLPNRSGLLFFGVVWMLAVACLAFNSSWGWVVRALGQLFAVAIFIGVTVYLTANRPSTGGEKGHEKRKPQSRIYMQLAAAVILATLATLRFYDIPLWNLVYDPLHSFSASLPLPFYTYFENPVLYIVFPGLAMLLLGARWKELGFHRGNKSWHVTALWSAPVVAFWIYLLAAGQTGFTRIGRELISNTFQNGFGEEFLWRGVIQTRIGKLWGEGWELGLASLGFGIWHLDAVLMTVPSGSIWIAAAICIVNQATIGLGFAVIFNRTRNLLAPSLVHIVANSMDV